MKAFAKRFALVFALWTIAAICGGLADYLFADLLGRHPAFWAVFRRPLTEQWIWAALTPLVLFVAHRFPLARPALARAIAVHVAAFLLLSLLHCVLAGAVGGPLLAVPAHYPGSLLKLRFLEEIYGDIWMYWPLVCIQALIDSHARAREREKRAAELETLLATSHLALLRAQIQPHFLFNTLHAVSALVRIDAGAAEDMIADLAEILRAAFADSTLQETTVQRELDLVACYLRIQQRRFSDRLRVNYRIAPQVLPAALPSLVLQSLVENAVIHRKFVRTAVAQGSSCRSWMTAPVCSPGTARAWVLPTRGGGCASCTANSSRSKCRRLAAAASPPRCRFPSTTLRVARHRRWSFVKIRTLSGDDEAPARHTLSLLLEADTDFRDQR